MTGLLWLLTVPITLALDWAIDDDGARAWWLRSAEAARVRALMCPCCRTECGWEGSRHHGQCGKHSIYWSD